ncbi:unnamed protein product [Fusarium venenatum]|uniref:Uncharacterized protein n=1 Tax=Fusarium venenatum TaxID=56646 RepID=A0A2L2TLC6_9HYPO|nr:uncharacterized protein FVRRES_00488 [Fusarium venenatum]CEI63976.1 unnamed protein product [Fusarium venenatum]
MGQIIDRHALYSAVNKAAGILEAKSVSQYYGGSLGCRSIDRLCVGYQNQAFIGIMIPDP